MADSTFLTNLLTAKSKAWFGTFTSSLLARQAAEALDSAITTLTSMFAPKATVPLYVYNKSNVALTWNNVDTTIAGGVSGGANLPSASCTALANTLSIGSTIRCVVTGLCTSSVANNVVFSMRAGTTGTTADTAYQTHTVAAAAAGVNIPFIFEFWTKINTPGATASVNCMGYLSNSAVTGISSTQFVQAQSQNVGSLATTGNLIFSLSVASAAATTAGGIESATMEILL